MVNWSVTGSGFVSISQVVPTTDSQSVDLIIASAIPAGAWIVTAAANMVSFGGAVITSPRSLSFNVISIVNQTVINPGSVNNNCVDIIRKHLNPALKGPGWDALIAGIAAGDCPNFENNLLGFDQLFVSSSSEKYLTRLTSNYGITRPTGVGLSDDVYRKLAIKLNSTKVVNQSILEVLSVFYGEDIVRANATSETTQPFLLADGYELIVKIDGKKQAIIVFNSDEFELISQASALEVAAAITRNFLIQGVSAFATTITDTETGLVKVRIYSGGLGLQGRVQITGGRAQNALNFSEELSSLVYTGTV